MKHNYSSEYSKVIIKPLKIDQIEGLRTIRNKLENRVWFINSSEISQNDQQNWFKKYLEVNNDFMFSIYLRDNPKLFIGAVGIYNVDFVSLTAEFGRIVIDKSRIIEKGIGRDATISALKFGFKVLKLDSIYLEVYRENYRAINMYHSVGFEDIDNNNKSDLIRMEIANRKFIF